MDMYNNANANYGQQYGYGQYGGNPYFYGNAYMQNPNLQVPGNQNALTDEEISRLMSLGASTNVLNLNISSDDVLRGICSHKSKNHQDVVQLINDGSGDVWCPICKSRWSPEPATKEEATELINKLISLMQNAKWTGEFPQNVVREYFSMIPLLEKFPDLYEYGSKNFERFLNQKGYYSASDANIYNQYNSLFGPGMGYGAAQYYQPQQGYYQQPQGGYYQQQMPQGQPAQATVNPMQAPQGGYAPQQQAVPQGQQMPGINMYSYPMGPGPQMMPQQPYTPVYGTPQVTPQQPAPQAQPTAQTAAPAPTATTTTDTKVDL